MIREERHGWREQESDAHSRISFAEAQNPGLGHPKQSFEVEVGGARRAKRRWTMVDSDDALGVTTRKQISGPSCHKVEG